MFRGLSVFLVLVNANCVHYRADCYCTQLHTNSLGNNCSTPQSCIDGTAFK